MNDGRGPVERRRSARALREHLEGLGGFRVVTALGLGAHFVADFQGVPPLLDGSAIFEHDVGGMPLVAPSSWLGSGLATSTLQLVYASAIALCVALLFNIWPRSSGALLCMLSIAAYRALLPLAYVEDTVAIWASLWMVLLPVRRGLQGGSGPTVDWAARVPIACLMAQVLLLDAVGVSAPLSGATDTTARLVTLVLRIAAVCLISPTVHLRTIGCVLQAVPHMYLGASTSAHTYNICMAAAALVFRRPAEEFPAAGPRLDVLGVSATALMALWVTGVVARWNGPPLVAPGLRHLMEELGLAPAVRTPSVAGPGRFVVYVASAAAGGIGLVPAYEYSASKPRARLLASYFAAGGMTPMGARVAAALGAKYCRSQVMSVGGEYIMYGNDLRPVARFACDSLGGSVSFSVMARDL